MLTAAKTNIRHLNLQYGLFANFFGGIGHTWEKKNRSEKIFTRKQLFFDFNKICPSSFFEIKDL